MSNSDEGPNAAAPDWTEQTEQALLDAAIVRLANLVRWDQRLVDQAATDVGLTPSAARLVLPDGPKDLAALLSRRMMRRRSSGSRSTQRQT